MADMDKTLPNVKTSIEVNPQEEIEIEQQKAEEAADPGVEVNPLEDGGVEVNFDPSKVNIEGQPGHFDNLAELLPEDTLEPIGNELTQNYIDYKASRKDWEQSYTTGLDLLGFKYENRFKVHQVQHTQFLQKLLHSFKQALTKNYYQQRDRLEHK